MRKIVVTSMCLCVALGVALGGQTRDASSAVAANGLVAAYGFDEGSGTVLHDSSGNLNDGTIANATWAAGKYGGALTFNGTNSMVTVPGSATLAPTGAVTVEAWVRPSTDSSWRAVAVKERSSSNPSYGLYAASDAGPAARVSTRYNRSAKDRTTLPLNAWSHVAAVYNGSSLSVYVNGSLVAQSKASGGIYETSGALRIGGDTIGSEWFQGAIDELRIYNRALSAGEIGSDMTTPVTTPPAPDQQPPTTPTGLSVGATTQTSVALSWNASSDNVGVTGYGVYNGATSAGQTPSTSYVVTGLACGTSYTLAVDAADAAGNRSGKTSVTATTAACPAPPPDQQPPTTPTGLSAGATTQTSVALSWNASSDNVGVTGYGVYTGATSAGQTPSTSYLVAGLACGTSYTLAVDAFDAAGNRSAKASVSATTAACTGPPPAGSANLWVDTNGGTCTRLATPGAYADAQACSSVAAAFSAASCGDVVGVTAGSYPGVTLSAAKSCSPTTPVTFTAANPVTFTSGVNLSTSFIAFSGPFAFTGGWSIPSSSASYISLTGVSAPHAFVLGSHVTVHGGSIGPNNNCTTGVEDGLQIWDNGSVSATYVTIDGVTIHDITDNGNQCAGYPNAGVHTDCIQILGASNITIENSTFYNCATSDVIGRPYTTPFHDILIQNNMMAGVVTPGADINIGNSADVCNNVVVQYNTALGAYPSLICGAGGSGNIARGNIFAGYYAQTGFTNSYNVTEKTTPLGSGSRECTPVFNPASSSTANYHLSAADTCATHAGDPANFPTTDLDGDNRTSVPDAGADQVS